ncbi:hypothetical protein [Lentzea sp. NPDC051838]|uniref:hypothetical protein n=1 Tax=Lentzea sp. NPDC051838 TaxID=3154849 RepID=UPI00343BA58E
MTETIYTAVPVPEDEAALSVLLRRWNAIGDQHGAVHGEYFPMLDIQPGIDCWS